MQFFQPDSSALAALYSQPANFANAFGSAFGSYAGGLTGMAQAMANERSNLYGANAMAEAARMGALGNIGSAGLGAYGSASNAAMNAWAQNQAAYNQAAALMHSANQQGLSGYGASQALAQGNAAAAQAAAMGQIGAARATQAGQTERAGLLAPMLFGAMGGGNGQFNATGIGGPVATGSYSAPGGGGLAGLAGGVAGGGSVGPGLGDLNFRGATQDIDGREVLSGLRDNARAGRDQIDRQHMSSRGMPSDMLSQILGGIGSLTGNSQNAIGSGMNQFYGNQQYAGNQFMDSMRGLRNDMNAGYGNVGNQIQGMWNSSLANVPAFQTPAQRARQDREAQNLNTQYAREDKMRQMRDMARDPGPIRPAPGAPYGYHQAYAFNAANHSNRKRGALDWLAAYGGGQ